MNLKKILLVFTLSIFIISSNLISKKEKTLLEQIDRLDKNILEQRNKIESLKGMINSHREEEKRLKAEREKLKDSLNKIRENIKKILPVLISLDYRLKVIKILSVLGMRDINSSRELIFMLTFASNRFNEKLGEGTFKLKELREAENKLTSLRIKEEDTLSRLNQSISQLETLRKQKLKELKLLKKYERERGGDIYAKLSADIKVRKIKNLKDLEKYNTLNWKNRIVSPLRGKIEKIEGKGGGVLIYTPEENNVYSCSDGEVEFNGWLRGLGIVVIIGQPPDFHYVYAHLSKSLVSVGDDINKGDLIGRTGSTGISERPSLYFEIRKGERRVPREELKRVLVRR